MFHTTCLKTSRTTLLETNIVPNAPSSNRTLVVAANFAKPDVNAF